MKTLYKKDTKKNLRFLTISTEGSILIQESGIVGTDSPIKHEKECTPKNVGKVNATTGEEQAVSQMNSLIEKKLKEGYFETKEETNEFEVILPMLAKVYEKEAKKIDWSNCYVQPKLDGMRCLDTVNGKISRKNTPIETMDHIVINRPGTSNIIVDGELYAHGLSFQENMKLIKKKRPESVNVKHHVYDIISNSPFRDRNALLKAIVMKSTNLELVPTYKVTSMEEVKEYHSKFLGEGYEGTMIRWGNEGYKINGRSSNLLKYKDFIDKTYTIVDVLPSEADPEIGVIHCKLNKSDETFGCGMKFSHLERKEILANKANYIGKTAEVRFFEFTDGGIPRFPVVYGFRLDK